MRGLWAGCPATLCSVGAFEGVVLQIYHLKRPRLAGPKTSLEARRRELGSHVNLKWGGPEYHQEMQAITMEDTHEAVISLANRAAGPRDRQFVFAATALLLLAFAAVTPFVRTPLPEFNAFIPSVSAVMSINDLITSVLLYAQCAIAPSRGFVVLAGAYLFTAFVIIPHSLTFPGAFTATGLLGASQQTSPWLYFSAHFVFPVALLAYAQLKDQDRISPLRPSATRSAIGASVVVALVSASGLTLLSTAGGQYLPILLTDRTHALGLPLIMTNLSIIAITTVALVAVWRRRHTVLDYWLMLISVALILEEACFSLSRTRFTVGYYAGRVFWLITSIVVLILLLQETVRLYTLCARSYGLLQRERDNKLLNAQAITASIAHEVRQPLTAIIASSGAALEYLGKVPPEHEKARLALNKIMKEGHRTGDVFDGIHALFKRGDQKQESVDLNEIVISVLESLRGDLTDHGVGILSELTELPLVEGRRNQLQQVVFNLVHNALEAMQITARGKRTLRIATEYRGRAAVALVVEDSGPGINPDQLDSIFNAFVTTKKHGMGLGLAICRQIVEHHNGQLLATSNGASGAQFQVILPVKSTESAVADA
jgi:signal transduction histidine kinase